MNSDKDLENLRLLSIFHYVVAGLLALFAMFPFMHVAFGIAIVGGAFDNVDSGTPPPRILGWVLIVVPAIVIMTGWALALAIAVAGRRLRDAAAYRYCLVVAGIECLFTPFGTILGVFTIIVLTRPTVRALFGVDSPAGVDS